MLYATFFVAVALRLSYVSSDEGAFLHVSNVSDEELKAAIKSLHGQLDDNSDGKLDVSESQDFVSSELGHSGSEKSHTLHRNDLSITFEELWDSWLKSEVYHWGNKDMIAWLENQVELSGYSERFQKLNITGRHLPSIAVNARQFIQLVLKITNIQHRTKLQVRAMDTVLFGPQPSHPTYWKDGIVLLLLTLCVILFFSAVFQRRYAQKRIDSFLEESRVYERELNELKIKLEQWQEDEEEDVKEEEGVVEEGTKEVSKMEGIKENEVAEEEWKETEEEWKETEEGRKEMTEEGDEAIDGAHPATSEVQQSEGVSIPPASISPNSTTQVRSPDAQEELTLLREKVKVLETHLETQRLSRDTLHPMLVQCYRREQKYLDSKKRRAEEDMLQAQLMCEKIRKKRSTLIDAFRLANSSALEDASTQMNKAINKMQKMSDSLDEYHERWDKIEQLCGFNVCHTSADGAKHTTPSRKISRTSTMSNSTSSIHETAGQQEPLTNPNPPMKPSLVPIRDRYGSHQSLARDEEIASARSISEAPRLGRVSSITTSVYSSREELGGPTSSVGGPTSSVGGPTTSVGSPTSSVGGPTSSVTRRRPC